MQVRSQAKQLKNKSEIENKTEFIVVYRSELEVSHCVRKHNSLRYRGMRFCIKYKCEEPKIEAYLSTRF